MNRMLAKSLIVLGAALGSSSVSALGLGELELKSALNQPLSAEIELLNVQDLTSWEIKPAVATQADFERAGVEYSFFLDGVEFEVVDNTVKLSTVKPVAEPFLNFLIEVKWPAGRVLREYTLLLDPPVFEDTEVPALAAAPVSQPTYEESASAAQVQQPVAAQPAPAVQSEWESEPAQDGSYKVQYSDTLWEIALATRPDGSVSPQQMMLAIQDANPEAFINGNINRLKTHHILRIPNGEEVASRDFNRAVAEVRRQNDELYGVNDSVAQIDATDRAAENAQVSGGSDGGELRLVAAAGQESDQAQAGGEVGEATGEGVSGMQSDLIAAQESLDKSRLENKELRDKLASLEEQIATMQKLVSLKNDPLAAAQAAAIAEQAAEAEAQINDAQQPAENADGEVDFNYEEAPADTESADGTTAVAENSVESEEVLTGESTVDASSEVVTDEAVVEDVADTPAAPVPAPQPPKTFVDELLENPALMGQIGGGALLLILLGVYAVQKRRKAAEDSEDESMATLDDFSDEELAEFDNGEGFAEGEIDEGSLEDFELGDEDLMSADLDGDEELDIDAVEAAEEAPEAQTSDVIGESDIYIAYGRFDQAVELLDNAIAAEPARSDLRLKLLEVYVEMDDSKNFASSQAGLVALGDADANQQAEVLAGRLSTPVALSSSAPTDQLADNLSDEMAELDDVAGLDDVPDLSLSDELPEFDLGDSASASTEVEDEFAGGLDFADALDLTDSSMNFDESPEESVVETDGLEDLESSDDLSLDFDLGEVEVPELDAGVALDAEPADELSDLDSADELDETSLDFDLSGLDAADEEVVPELTESEVETDDVSLEFDASPVAEQGSDSDDLAELESLLDSEADESLDFDLDDVVSLDDEIGSLNEAEAVPSLDASDDELDFGTDDLEQAVELDVPAVEEIVEVPVVETSVETPSVEAPIADESVASSDDGEIDLDSLVAADDDFDFLAGTDECATKLDLARAYIDMEDVDGARELLDEVIVEGSDQQKQDARELMDGLS